MLPLDIDGTAVYHIPLGDSDRNIIPRDGRPWQKAQTCNVKGMPKGTRKIQVCDGANVCTSDTCVYFMEYHMKNRVHTKYSVEYGGNICSVCEAPTNHNPCNARKLTEFHKNEHIVVKHHGKHTCLVTSHCAKGLPEEVKELLKRAPQMKPRVMQKEILSSMLDKGKTMEELKDKAKEMLNRQAISNERKKRIWELPCNIPQYRGYSVI